MKIIASLPLFLLLAASAAEPASPPAKSHITTNDVAWTGSQQYPPELLKVYRYKALIGGTKSGVLPQDDVLMGTLELAPGAIYPAHQHPAPEIYYVISGTAHWTVGDETFDAAAGTAVYHAPNTLHRMINTGADTLKVVYLWWAPGGDRSVLRAKSELLEPVPPQPPQAKFSDTR